jgi:uncharacterized protein (TIGR03437 family)
MIPYPRFLSLAILILACPAAGRTATWTPLANLAPAGAGTMILLTDGTVMVQQSDRVHWMKLTPDNQGSYIKGDWTINAIGMGRPRLWYASQVLPDGKVWVLGGEYSGIGLAKNWTATGEIFDPLANAWSAISPFPNQSGCGRVTEFGGTTVNGSAVIGNIASTAGWQAGWIVTGTGIPAGAVIAGVDSPTQIHLVANSTRSNNIPMTLTTQAMGNLIAGSPVISGISSTAGYQVAWGITGIGIPAGSTILSVDSATAIHISQNATATGTGVALELTVAVRPPACFGDDPSILLPGGKVLAGDIANSRTYLYDIATDSWTQGASKAYSDRSDEEGWAKLADGTVLTYDIFESESQGRGYAERYDPVANTWTSISPSDGTANGVLPVLSSTAVGNELGPMLRLYDNRVFVIGANGHTALYTPATNTWAAGPDIMGTLGGQPFLFAADDAPAAILPSGHVILAADGANGITSSGSTTADSPVLTGIPSTAQLQVGWAVTGTGIPAGAVIQTVDSTSQVTISENATATRAGTVLKFGGTFSSPTELFDFDPSTNLISPVSPAIPDTGLVSDPSYVTRMLMLPTGQLLLSDSKTQLWVYTPDGAAKPALQPTIATVSSKGGGSFTLSGTRLTGQSAGAAYGDDVQSDENYPIVSLVSASGNVSYARTTNWSYVGVGGGSTPQTVDFTLNPTMPPGTYSLIVSAAGLSSNPATVVVASDLSKITVLPAVSSIQDAESARSAIVSGQWTAIYGQGLANSTRQWNNSDFPAGVAPGSPLPTALDGVSVTIGGKAAAVYYVSPGQIDVQAPSNLPLGNASVAVINNGLVTAQFLTTVVQSSPSFFSYGAGASLYTAAVHLSGKLVGDPTVLGGAVEAAHPGEVIAIYANGLAASSAGVVVTQTSFTSTITIAAGNFPLTIVGAALVSAGQFQINVQIPSNIAPGSYALTMTVPNGSTATAGVTVLLPVGP